MRGLSWAAIRGVTVLALAGPGSGCDVHVRPIWDPTDGGSLPCPDESPDQVVGYASAGLTGETFPTTGGGTAAPVTVNASDGDALTQFKTYADRKTGPAVIQIKGMISFDGFSSSQVRVASDTTIVGMDAQSGFTGGGLDLNGNSNIIIKNLVIAKAVGTDAVTIQGPDSTNIWIDHCDLSSELHADGASYDGLVDITHAADWITISWTTFHDHRDTGIIGHSDSNGAEDQGFLHVTYYKDWFRNVVAGPRVRFGMVHVLNVFFDHVTYYGVASTMGAQVRVENNVFRSVTEPGGDPDYGPVTTMLSDSDQPGFVDLEGNDEDATDAPDVTPAAQTDSWDPHRQYTYIADAPTSALALVQSCAGPRPTPGRIAPGP